MKKVLFRKEMNFRDLGGYPTLDHKVIKEGLFYRTGALNLLNEEELETLKSLNVKMILDLRTKKEWEANPDPILEGVTYLQHSGVETTGGKEIDFSPTGMRQMGQAGQKQLEKLTYYYTMIPYQNEALHIFFEQIKNQNTPILFHCFTGKDRTGVAAMLLLGLLNVDKEILIQDYLLSNEYFKDVIAKRFSEVDIDLTAHPETKELLQMCFGVTEKIGRAIIDKLLDKYGSFENYFKEEYHYTEQDIQNIRNYACE